MVVEVVVVVVEEILELSRVKYVQKQEGKILRGMVGEAHEGAGHRRAKGLKNCRMF